MTEITTTAGWSLAVDRIAELSGCDLDAVKADLAAHGFGPDDPLFRDDENRDAIVQGAYLRHFAWACANRVADACTPPAHWSPYWHTVKLVALIHDLGDDVAVRALDLHPGWVEEDLDDVAERERVAAGVGLFIGQSAACH